MKKVNLEVMPGLGDDGTLWRGLVKAAAEIEGSFCPESGKERRSA